MSTASQLVLNIDPGVDNNTYSTLEQNIENHSKAFMFNFSQKSLTSVIHMPWDISKHSIDHSHYYMLYDNNTSRPLYQMNHICLKTRMVFSQLSQLD